MGRITEETLHHLAHLARIELDPARTEGFMHDLEAIIAHVARLETVPTDGIEPMVGAADTKNILRADEPDLDAAGLAVDASENAVAAFPETENGYLKVPKVL